MVDEQYQIYIERIDSLKRKYLYLTQPYLEEKKRIISISIPKIVVPANGGVCTYEYSPETTKQLADIDEIINYFKYKFDEKRKEEYERLYVGGSSEKECTKDLQAAMFHEKLISD